MLPAWVLYVMDEDKGFPVIKSLVITAASALITVVVFRLATQPDAFKTLRMLVARSGEEYAQGNAEAWAHTADMFRHVYDNARTTV